MMVVCDGQDSPAATTATDVVAARGTLAAGGEESNPTDRGDLIRHAVLASEEGVSTAVVAAEVAAERSVSARDTETQAAGTQEGRRQTVASLVLPGTMEIASCRRSSSPSTGCRPRPWQKHSLARRQGTRRGCGTTTRRPDCATVRLKLATHAAFRLSSIPSTECRAGAPRCCLSAATAAATAPARQMNPLIACSAPRS